MNKQYLQISSYTFRKSGFLLFKNLVSSQIALDLTLTITMVMLIVFNNLPAIVLENKLLIVAASIIIVFALKTLLTIVIFLDWVKDIYQIRHKELIHRHGVFFTVYDELAMEIVEEIKYKQSFVGRMLGYATLVITMRHSPRDQDIIKTIDYVPSHLTVVEIIENAMQRELDRTTTAPPEI